jgi:hypothetical protein
MPRGKNSLFCLFLYCFLILGAVYPGGYGIVHNPFETAPIKLNIFLSQVFCIS